MALGVGNILPPFKFFKSSIEDLKATLVLTLPAIRASFTKTLCLGELVQLLKRLKRGDTSRLEFKSNESLILHQCSVHEKIKYPCEICGKEYMLKRHFMQHIKTGHNTFGYSCEICSKAFKISSKFPAKT